MTDHKSAATYHPGAGPDVLVEKVRQALDDETLTRTGRSIGDLASEHVARAVLAALAPEFARVRLEGAAEALREAADDLELDRDAIAGLWMRVLGVGDNGPDDTGWVQAYAFAAEVESGVWWNRNGDPS